MGGLGKINRLSQSHNRATTSGESCACLPQPPSQKICNVSPRTCTAVNRYKFISGGSCYSVSLVDYPLRALTEKVSYHLLKTLSLQYGSTCFHTEFSLHSPLFLLASRPARRFQVYFQNNSSFPLSKLLLTLGSSGIIHFLLEHVKDDIDIN